MTCHARNSPAVPEHPAAPRSDPRPRARLPTSASARRCAASGVGGSGAAWRGSAGRLGLGDSLLLSRVRSRSPFFFSPFFSPPFFFLCVRSEGRWAVRCLPLPPPHTHILVSGPGMGKQNRNPRSDAASRRRSPGRGRWRTGSAGLTPPRPELGVRELGSFVRGSPSPSPRWPSALLATAAVARPLQRARQRTHAARTTGWALPPADTAPQPSGRARGSRVPPLSGLSLGIFHTTFGGDRLPRVFIYLFALLFVYLPVYLLRPLRDCCELGDFVVVVVGGFFCRSFGFFLPPSLLFPALPPTPCKLFVFPGVSKHRRGSGGRARPSRLEEGALLSRGLPRRGGAGAARGGGGESPARREGREVTPEPGRDAPLPSQGRGRSCLFPYLPRILLTQPWLTRSCLEMSQGRTPW